MVDVRNHYEHEVGHFEGALLPDAGTFAEELPLIKKCLKAKKSRRCFFIVPVVYDAKTSAWLKDKGFKDVNQLHGGIIDYKRQTDEHGLENKFIGKNFVFDDRLGERISKEVIANCHTCGKPSDDHLNCAWEACHILFIQCSECRLKLEECCSDDCRQNLHLPEEEKKISIKKCTETQRTL